MIWMFDSGRQMNQCLSSVQSFIQWTEQCRLVPQLQQQLQLLSTPNPTSSPIMRQQSGFFSASCGLLFHSALERVHRLCSTTALSKSLQNANGTNKHRKKCLSHFLQQSGLNRTLVYYERKETRMLKQVYCKSSCLKNIFQEHHFQCS